MYWLVYMRYYSRNLAKHCIDCTSLLEFVPNHQLKRMCKATNVGGTYFNELLINILDFNWSSFSPSLSSLFKLFKERECLNHALSVIININDTFEEIWNESSVFLNSSAIHSAVEPFFHSITTDVKYFFIYGVLVL